MKYLLLNRSFYSKMLSHCSLELINAVFNDLGNDKVLIDDNNQQKDTWTINDNFLKGKLPLIEKFKVLLTFGRLYGIIIYRGEELSYEALCSILGYKEMYDVLTFWRHNEMNDVIPTFDLGKIEIPKIMPRYICTKLSNTSFVVELWCKGEYIPANEIYPTKELCEARVNELNDEYDEI